MPLADSRPRSLALPRRRRIALLILAAAFAAPALPATEARAQEGDGGRTLGFTDLMRIRQVEDPSISADGAWIAFTAAPDRGDPEVVIRSTDSGARFSVPLGSDPVFAPDGSRVALRLVASLADRETADDRSSLRDGAAVVSLPGGEVERIDEVRRFAFSPDGRWLALHRYPPREGRRSGADTAAVEAGAAAPGEEEEDEAGTELVLRDRSGGGEVVLADVTAFAFSHDGTHLAYAVGSPRDEEDGVRVLTLGSGAETVAHARPDAVYRALTWGEHGTELAFFAGAPSPDDGVPVRGEIALWADGASTVAVTAADAPEGWFVPADTDLEWSDDGARLSFGWRPMRPDEADAMADAVGAGADAEARDPGGSPAASADPAFDPWDVDAILADRGVDVWHWQDPRIIPQQKVLWDREKNRTYRAVRHRDGTVVALADPGLPEVDLPEAASPVALAATDLPYRLEATWTGGAEDAWLVDLRTGARTPVAEGLESSPSLSPGGGHLVWWADGRYHLLDVATGARRTPTDGLGVPFADEDWDYPAPVPGYGVAGWLADDSAVLLYDKYDIWVVPTDGADPWSLTEGRGREEKRIFRLENVEGPLEPGAELLLTSYHDLRKNYGFHRARADRPGVRRLLEEDKRFVFIAAADSTDRVLYSREAYDEFPDLWVAEDDFARPRKVTDVNPGLTDTFAWGSAELLEWTSLDGIPLQGVVIKPGNYEEGRRYPVLVYYYRFFSQRLHEFNDPSVNHRPSFPIYASDGYVVFLPDVRFQVGRPGPAATKSVVPGVQKLIEVGIADPDAIALHGHSWSGYQTAYMVTETDLFATAIAGAPVANMTSAYSGIRLGTGLARQFQYERTQSRIGGSLWESLDEYIENSPLFYADRIETPLLILHGDVDDAVPWEQSIELFLAMRRLGKEAVFLQYRDEPHHPQRYANKLDWAMKMKEWVDHYLKGAPAPAWIEEGIPYRGR